MTMILVLLSLKTYKAACGVWYIQINFELHIGNPYIKTIKKPDTIAVSPVHKKQKRHDIEHKKKDVTAMTSLT